MRQLGHDCVSFACALDLAAARDRLRELQPDVVFNLVESLENDDALAHVLPAVLDALGIPYTGNTAATTFLTTHKLLAKRWLQQAGLPTPAWIESGRGLSQSSPHENGTVPFCSKHWRDASGTQGCCPAFTRHGRNGRGTRVTWIIKGVWEQASRNLDEDAILADADEPTVRAELERRAARLARPCFAEEFVDGREFNVSVLDGPDGPQVLPPAEIDFSAFPPEKPRIVGYRAKWQADSFEYQNTPRRFDFPAADGPLLEQLRSLSLECWTAVRPARLRAGRFPRGRRGPAVDPGDQHESLPVARRRLRRRGAAGRDLLRGGNSANPRRDSPVGRPSGRSTARAHLLRRTTE